MKRYLAEAIGTFILVFCGVGAAVLAGSYIGVLGVALAFGLILLALVYAIGPISGCHVNPAVTIGVCIARGMKARDAVGYISAQVIGAVIAAAAIIAIAQGAAGGYDIASGGLGANGFDEHSPGEYGMGAAMITEIVVGFIFLFVILMSTDKRAPQGFAGISIGLTLTFVHLVAIPVTNASLNPARSIGPAIFVGGWAIEQLWLFIVAPVIGAAIAGLLYKYLRSPSAEESGVEQQREKDAKSATT